MMFLIVAAFTVVAGYVMYFWGVDYLFERSGYKELEEIEKELY